MERVYTIGKFSLGERLELYTSSSDVSVGCDVELYTGSEINPDVYGVAHIESESDTVMYRYYGVVTKVLQ